MEDKDILRQTAIEHILEFMNSQKSDFDKTLLKTRIHQLQNLGLTNYQLS